MGAAWARHGRGMGATWARHPMCEAAFTERYENDVDFSIIPGTYCRHSGDVLTVNDCLMT
jgi:hypothetical protein